MSSKQTNLISFFSNLTSEKQQYRPLSERVAVITACSKKKLDHQAPASELYQGDMFKKSKRIAQKLGADFYILSAKHGLIKGSKIIEPYETVIQNKKDKDRLRSDLNETILEKLTLHEKVIIIMGQKYREVLEPFFQDNYYVLRSKSGLGEYKQLLKDLLTLSPSRFFQAIKRWKYRRLEMTNV